MGFEPTTISLATRSSTSELPPRYLVDPIGIEPMTS